MEGLDAGSWSNQPQDEEPIVLEEQPEPKETPEVEITPEVNDELVEALQTIDASLNPKKDIVYYPCSGPDVSVSKAFPDSRVVFVDINKNIMDALKSNGYEAYAQSALEFTLEPKADILLILNPSINPDQMLDQLQDGGVVICNDYHSTATDITKRPNFLVIGALTYDEKGTLYFNQENAREYIEIVETDEQFQNARGGWSTASYEEARQAVEALHGDTGNVLEEFKKIIEKSREQFDSGMIMIKTDDGNNLYFSTKLPTKSGTDDSLIAFRKKLEKEGE